MLPETAIRTLLLVGAGHAHLHLLREARHLLAAGLRPVVLAPTDFYYSGLATGVLAGDYPAARDRIAIAPLLPAEAELRRTTLQRLDARAQRAWLGDGDSLNYDFCSLNLGSVARPPPPGLHRQLLPIKPIDGLLELRPQIEAACLHGSLPQVVVIGGGLSGCEISCCLSGLARRRGRRLPLSLLAADGVLPSRPSHQRRQLAAALARQRVRVIQARVQRLHPTAVELADGRRLAADLVILATGLQAPSLLAASELPCAENGSVLVDADWRVQGTTNLWAIGDCAEFTPQPLAKIGVHAIHGSRILLANLLAAARGRPGQAYRPRRWQLSIANCGDGRAVASYGRLSGSGRLAWHWKDLIDRGWLETAAKPAASG